MTESPDILIWLAYLFIGVALLEVAFQRFLPVQYYRYGLPLQRRKFDLSRAMAVRPCLRALKKQFGRENELHIVFVQIGEGETAYWPGIYKGKEGALGGGAMGGTLWGGKRRFPSFSHGLLKVDKSQNTLVATAYLNWIIPPFFLLWFAFAYIFPPTAAFQVAVFGLGILGLAFIYAREKYGTREFGMRLRGVCLGKNETWTDVKEIRP